MTTGTSMPGDENTYHGSEGRAAHIVLIVVISVILTALFCLVRKCPWRRSLVHAKQPSEFELPILGAE